MNKNDIVSDIILARVISNLEINLMTKKYEKNRNQPIITTTMT